MEIINTIKLSETEKDAIDVLTNIDCSELQSCKKCPFYSSERLHISKIEDKNSVKLYKTETESNCLVALIQNLTFKING